MRRRSERALLIAVAVAGCIERPSYFCVSDDDCVDGRIPGRCEPIGACSFAAADCPAPGRRYGVLAEGTLSNRCVTPRPVAIAAGASHTCVRREDDSAVCWGANADGQLGVGAISPRNANPGEPVTLAERFFDLSLGSGYSCAIAGDDRKVYCWGRNSRGQIGPPGVQGSSDTPVELASGAGGFSGVDILGSGDAHSCAADETRATCWGDNSRRQLGSENLGVAAVELSFPEPASAIAAGGSHSCAIANGTVACWGANDRQQSGSSDPGDAATPTAVPLPGGSVAGGAAVRLALGRAHSCAVLALDTAPRIACWGDNLSGQLAQSEDVESSFLARPFPVPGAGEIAAVDAGDDHSCALRGGTVYCWGANDAGQLGVAVPAAGDPVVEVPQLEGVIAIAAGGRHTCALSATGAVHCWGANDDGQLGNGTIESTSVPDRTVTEFLAIGTSP